jgi:hypothetical protein
LGNLGSSGQLDSWAVEKEEDWTREDVCSEGQFDERVIV